MCANFYFDVAKYKRKAKKKYRKKQKRARNNPNFQTITLHIRSVAPMAYCKIFSDELFFCSGKASDTNN